MTFIDPVTGLKKGPYKTKGALISKWKALKTRRERYGLPAYAKKMEDIER